MKNLLLITACIYFSLYARSQEKVDNINDYIYDNVYKNIAAFKIRHARHNDMFWSNGDFFYQMFMPDYGYRLEMQIEKLDSAYPNPKFHLYKVIVNKMDFIPDNHDLPMISSQYREDFPYFSLALNENNGDIKFISGEFFRSHISGDFPVNKDDPKTLIPYIRLRAFFVGGVNIKYKRKKHKKWIFEGYSELFKKPFLITVDRKDIDMTQTTIEGRSW